MRYLCPFCDWYFDSHFDVFSTPPIVTTYAGVVAEATKAHWARIETALQDHLDSHVDEMAAGPQYP